jgi:HAD superfamily hydrolase (TIGR01549 family)
VRGRQTVDAQAANGQYLARKDIFEIPIPNSTDRPPIAQRRTLDWRPQAIAFDCYDTLLTITNRRGPYQQLAALAGGRLDPSPMTLPMSLRDVVERNMPRIELRAGILEKLEADLLNELASVQPLPGAIEALQHLRDLGYRLAVASNLALPYSEPLKNWLGSLVDVQILSFEVGSAKPSALFYEETCKRLAVEPSEVLMVGNSLKNDVVAAEAAGLQARHLRLGERLQQTLRDLLQG